MYQHLDQTSRVKLDDELDLIDLIPGSYVNILHYNYMYPDPVQIERVIDAIDPMIIITGIVQGHPVPMYFFASEVNMKPKEDSFGVLRYSGRKRLMRASYLSASDDLCVAVMFGGSDAREVLPDCHKAYEGPRVFVKN